jgi:prepilin-type N-terminal cleavage/methylation domain-containing protein
MIVRRRHPRGFTLIEASLVMVIIGVGVVAMLELMASGTKANTSSSQMVTGLSLARNVREHCLTLSYDEVRNLNGTTFTPPIAADGASLAGVEEWQQTITVVPVAPGNLLAAASGTEVNAVRITVHAVLRGQRHASLTWYQFKVGT